MEGELISRLESRKDLLAVLLQFSDGVIKSDQVFDINITREQSMQYTHIREMLDEYNLRLSDLIRYYRDGSISRKALEEQSQAYLECIAHWTKELEKLFIRLSTGS